MKELRRPLWGWRSGWPSRLGLGGSLIVSLGQIYERWDGQGPARARLRGEEVGPRAVLLVTLAQDAVVWNRIGGARRGGVATSAEA